MESWYNWKHLEMVREYLTGRHQHVRINSYTSSTLPVISSVPQGSLLGPLLFLTINDLPSSVEYTKLFLFADDTKCLQPMFNETKCSLLSIGPANENHHRYFINNQPIISSSLQKDLGILVSSDLSWYHHIYPKLHLKHTTS